MTIKVHPTRPGELGVYASRDIPVNKVIKMLIGWRRSPTTIAPDVNSMVEMLPDPIVQDCIDVVLDGPLYFVNSSCKPNCTWVPGSERRSIIRIKTLIAIPKGTEITVKYGPEFFDRGSCECGPCVEKKNRVTRKSREEKTKIPDHVTDHVTGHVSK